MANVLSGRDTTINLRAEGAQRDLIDRAAATQRKTRSQFMLEAACEKAEQVLLDQTIFVLDATRFDRFQAALQAAPRPSAQLLRLLSTRAPWE
jgi:uncharacterized protein (DUF1778 family)